jgi:spermidine synthase
VVLKIGDVADVIRQSPGVFDAILLDVDNGPQPITDVRNRDIYGPAGIQSCVTALRAGGSLARLSPFDILFDYFQAERLIKPNVFVG